MVSKDGTTAWGLIRFRRGGGDLPECTTVKDTVADLPVYVATERYPVWRVVRCPCGVHGCCGGKFPCLEAMK